MSSASAEGESKAPEVKKEVKTEVKAEGKAVGEPDGVTQYKPGQKFPVESPGSADRVFYESLLEEKKDSPMALKWCLEHGCFSYKTSLKVYAIVEKMKAGGKRSSSSSSSSSGSSKKKARAPKNAIISDAVGDAGMAGAMSEGMGTVTFG